MATDNQYQPIEIHTDRGSLVCKSVLTDLVSNTVNTDQTNRSTGRIDQYWGRVCRYRSTASLSHQVVSTAVGSGLTNLRH